MDFREFIRTVKEHEILARIVNLFDRRSDTEGALPTGVQICGLAEAEVYRIREEDLPWPG